MNSMPLFSMPYGINKLIQFIFKAPASTTNKKALVYAPFCCVFNLLLGHFLFQTLLQNEESCATLTNTTVLPTVNCCSVMIDGEKGAINCTLVVRG